MHYITTILTLISAELLAPPRERVWEDLGGPIGTLKSSPAPEKLSVTTYNVLAPKYATRSQFGYTSTKALSWEHRQNLILNEIRHRPSDFICLQEVDQENFQEFFSVNLAYNDYRGFYYQKTRANHMRDEEAKTVDGSAIFYKASK
jgi:CCR4-NOT transcription complex subunit 6